MRCWQGDATVMVLTLFAGWHAPTTEAKLLLASVGLFAIGSMVVRVFLWFYRRALNT